MNQKDHIFFQKDYPKRFCFDEKVAACFDNMLDRSIPLYGLMNEQLLWWLGEQMKKKPLRWLDIGCSTGESATRFLSACDEEQIKRVEKITLNDSSLPMIAQAKAKLAHWSSRLAIEFHDCSAVQMDFSKVDFISINYTLQFMDLAERSPLLKKIFSDSPPDARVFISEKLRSQDDEVHAVKVAQYESFKRTKGGYSQEEIERKKQSLVGILKPQSFEDFRSMCLAAGFRSVEPLQGWNHFFTFLLKK